MSSARRFEFMVFIVKNERIVLQKLVIMVYVFFLFLVIVCIFHL